MDHGTSIKFDLQNKVKYLDAEIFFNFRVSA